MNVERIDNVVGRGLSDEGGATPEEFRSLVVRLNNEVVKSMAISLSLFCVTFFGDAKNVTRL